jgi:hypothetical protein
MTKRTSTTLSLLVALGLTACLDDPTEVASPGRDAAPPTAQLEAFGMDAHYLELAREVPGFGGAFHDDTRGVVVHMARRDLALDADRIRDGLRSRLRFPGPRTSGDATVLAASAKKDIVLQEAAWDYGELIDFRGRAHGVFGLPGAVYTDIDEASNRVRIGVTREADQATFLAALEEQGVPAEAVTFTITEPIEPLRDETLRDRVQPLGGGLQLVYPHPTPGFIFLCTLGFNVDRAEPGRSTSYFVTNSHCTLDQGAQDGTPYYQQPIALPDDKYLVAREVLDPAYTDCGGGFVCRFSDASLARYETTRTPVKLGAIYRPESVNTGSLAIANSGRRFFSIVDEAPFPELGDVLSKVGRTTGWTRGEVIGTCLNVLQSGSNRVILCQDLVGADVAGGDSGSPVFMQHGNSKNATLYGVLWGGGPGLFVFSAMENIHFELGAFSVF